MLIDFQDSISNMFRFAEMLLVHNHLNDCNAWPLLFMQKFPIGSPCSPLAWRRAYRTISGSMTSITKALSTFQIIRGGGPCGSSQSWCGDQGSQFTQSTWYRPYCRTPVSGWFLVGRVRPGRDHHRVIIMCRTWMWGNHDRLTLSPIRSSFLFWDH